MLVISVKAYLLEYEIAIGSDAFISCKMEFYNIDIQKHVFGIQ
jgi:hypothetical protein